MQKRATLLVIVIAAASCAGEPTIDTDAGRDSVNLPGADPTTIGDDGTVQIGGFRLEPLDGTTVTVDIEPLDFAVLYL